MEIQQLKGFYYSVKLGSLTKAAERMSVTQSAVSQQIKSLEEELKVKLFSRIGPRKDLTPDGKLFFDLITPLIQKIEALKTTFTDMKGNQKGTLTIAATTVMIMHYLPPIIKKFTNKYHTVKLTILERRWNEIVSLAESDEIDFGIAPIVNLPQNLSYIKLEPIDRILITSLNHPLAKKKHVTPKDISNYPMITYEKGLVHRDEFDRVFDREKINIETIMEATNAETIKLYVEMGIGVAIIPKIAISPLSCRRLNTISMNKYFGRSQYGVILRKGKYITSWAKNFLLLLNPSIDNLI